LTAQGGAYALAGQSATINKGGVLNQYSLTCQGGTYNLAGQAITLARHRVLQALGADYAHLGQIATLYRHRYLAAGGADYTAIGSAARIDWINPASIGGQIQDARPRNTALFSPGRNTMNLAGTRRSSMSAEPRTYGLPSAPMSTTQGVNNDARIQPKRP
jgi:hypothetical protein